jgi:hypothetical protein
MAKQFVLYNLKDDRNEEDFEKWVNEFKGPLISGLSSVKNYTLTKVGGAVKAEGGPPGPADSPYRFVGIVDVTSLEDYAKDQETPIYKEEFMPKFMQWIKNVMILRAEEIFGE